ncbi:hypothetical protein IW261DRAFT_1613919 [Armillaria novae-zelandiae]|uniref:Ricin B lectin domain-containing protein n=1 Tax=Armillaria novae-zelandiae TaxID=153914 RepID=A0AA39NBV4_9AGAR|nr:hypothetical protein IW261DRAFT_1613919 [Armillaria novae-zelandiae]
MSSSMSFFLFVLCFTSATASPFAAWGYPPTVTPSVPVPPSRTPTVPVPPVTTNYPPSVTVPPVPPCTRDCTTPVPVPPCTTNCPSPVPVPPCTKDCPPTTPPVNPPCTKDCPPTVPPCTKDCPPTTPPVNPPCTKDCPPTVPPCTKDCPPTTPPVNPPCTKDCPPMVPPCTKDCPSQPPISGCHPNFAGAALTLSTSSALYWSAMPVVGNPLSASPAPSKFFFQQNGSPTVSYTVKTVADVNFALEAKGGAPVIGNTDPSGSNQCQKWFVDCSTCCSTDISQTKGKVASGCKISSGSDTTKQCVTSRGPGAMTLAPCDGSGAQLFDFTAV